MIDLNKKDNENILREVASDGQVWEFTVIRAEHDGVLVQVGNGDTQWLTNEEYAILNEKRNSSKNK
jgi:hypothetical protein